MHGHVFDATRSTETSLERALQEKRIMLEQNAKVSRWKDRSKLRVREIINMLTSLKFN